MSLSCNRVKTFRNRLFGCKAAVSRVWHSGGGGLAEFRKKGMQHRSAVALVIVESLRRCPKYRAAKEKNSISGNISITVYPDDPQSLIKGFSLKSKPPHATKWNPLDDLRTFVSTCRSFVSKPYRTVNSIALPSL